MKNGMIFLALLCSRAVFAADGGVTSLIPAFVNVSILLVALVYLLKDKTRVFFSDKSVAISDMINRASAKAKEAEEMMAIQKSKISNVDEEIKLLKIENEKLLATFESNYTKDVQGRIAKLEEDTKSKVEAEKAEMLSEINANLLDLVINNAKDKIKANTSLSEKATANLIKGL